MLRKYGSGSIIAALAFSFLAISVQPGTAEDTTLRGSSDALRTVPDNAAEIRFSYAPLVKRIAPAVVNVYAARQVKQRRSPFAGDPFFERFFGRGAFGGQARQRTARSLGSGVIVGVDGIVITNHHVIKDADQVKVALSDGREFEAEIKLIDKKSDLAVLKVDTQEDFPVVQLGDSEDLEVGDLVLAIGNPFGVGQTVTSGIVSALARSQAGIKDFGFFVQTDASINPGNSGGALIDMTGRLIGVNTAIYTRSGGSNGIGFAVPSNMVRVVLQSVRQGSDKLLRPWIGADFQAVTSDIADSLGLDRPRGALVAGVASGGPAEGAELKVGDVILMIDGKPVQHVNALGYRLATAGLGRVVDLTVLSRGERRKLKLALNEAPEVPERNVTQVTGRTPFTGATFANLSPRVAQEVGLSTSSTGVVVLAVDNGSPAARFGFRKNDILVAVNDVPIKDTGILSQVASGESSGWGFIIERGGRRLRQFVR